MDSEKQNFHTTKLLTTWWDLGDHYVLAVMFAVSVALVGLQTTQDHLICIPAVNCSNFPKNDSVVRRWSGFSDVLESCNQSASSIVLTKMFDRRYYDYIDKITWYKKMRWYSAHYSLISLAKAVILLAISNFWKKHPKGARALAHCEHLLLEFTKADILVPKDKEGQQQIQEQQQQQTEQKQAEQKLLKRLKVFEQCYSQKITKFNSSSVTGHYRLRGVVGTIVTIIALLVHAMYSSLSTGFTQCHLDSHVAFSTKHRFFQCTRSMELYFKVGSILHFVLLGLHLLFVFVSFVWSLIGERWEPVYTITSEKRKPRPLTSDGDAASPSGNESIAEGCLLLRCCLAAESSSGHESNGTELTSLTHHKDAPASSSGHESTAHAIESTLLTFTGDAAFLFHFIHKSNYSFLTTVIRYLLEKEEKKRKA